MARRHQLRFSGAYCATTDRPTASAIIHAIHKELLLATSSSSSPHTHTPSDQTKTRPSRISFSMQRKLRAVRQQQQNGQPDQPTQDTTTRSVLAETGTRSFGTRSVISVVVDGPWRWRWRRKGGQTNGRTQSVAVFSQSLFMRKVTMRVIRCWRDYDNVSDASARVGFELSPTSSQCVCVLVVAPILGFREANASGTLYRYMH